MSTLYRDEVTKRLYVMVGRAKTFGVYQYENSPQHYHVLLRSIDQYDNYMTYVIPYNEFDGYLDDDFSKGRRFKAIGQV